MIHLATIRAIADEAVLQITMGCRAYRSGDLLQGELHMSLGQVALAKLQRLLDADATPPSKPLRKLCVVGPREEDADLPAWMHKKIGGDDDAA